MKRYETVNPDMTHSVYYVGETLEIKRMYSALRKAIWKGNTNLMFLFVEKAVFNPDKQTYAICIEDGFIFTVNSDTMLSLIVSGDVKEM